MNNQNYRNNNENSGKTSNFVNNKGNTNLNLNKMNKSINNPEMTNPIKKEQYDINSAKISPTDPAYFVNNEDLGKSQIKKENEQIVKNIQNQADTSLNSEMHDNTPNFSVTLERKIDYLNFNTEEINSLIPIDFEKTKEFKALQSKKEFLLQNIDDNKDKIYGNPSIDINTNFFQQNLLSNQNQNNNFFEKNQVTNSVISKNSENTNTILQKFNINNNIFNFEPSNMNQLAQSIYFNFNGSDPTKDSSSQDKTQPRTILEDINIFNKFEEEKIQKSSSTSNDYLKPVKFYNESDFFMIEEEFYKIYNSFDDKNDLAQLRKTIEHVNLDSDITNQKIGPVSTLDYLIETSFKSDYNRKNSIIENLISLEDTIFRWRKIAGDGNCFYRAVIYAYFEKIIFERDLKLLKYHIVDFKNILEDDYINKKMVQHGVKTDLILKIFLIFFNTLKDMDFSIFNESTLGKDNLGTSSNKTNTNTITNPKSVESTYELFLKCFNSCKHFDIGLVMYFRYKLYQYIKQNENKLYSKKFSVSIGNLLPYEYETESGTFLFDKFYEDFLLKLYKDAEKIVIYLTPFLFNLNINVLAFDFFKNSVEKMREFTCCENEFKVNNKNNFNVTLLYRSSHYDLIYVEEYFTKYVKYLTLYVNLNENLSVINSELLKEKEKMKIIKEVNSKNEDLINFNVDMKDINNPKINDDSDTSNKNLISFSKIQMIPHSFLNIQQEKNVYPNINYIDNFNFDFNKNFQADFNSFPSSNTYRNFTESNLNKNDEINKIFDLSSDNSKTTQEQIIQNTNPNNINSEKSVDINKINDFKNYNLVLNILPNKTNKSNNNNNLENLDPFSIKRNTNNDKSENYSKTNDINNNPNSNETEINTKTISNNLPEKKNANVNEIILNTSTNFNCENCKNLVQIPHRSNSLDNLNISSEILKIKLCKKCLNQEIKSSILQKYMTFISFCKKNYLDQIDPLNNLSLFKTILFDPKLILNNYSIDINVACKCLGKNFELIINDEIKPGICIICERDISTSQIISRMPCSCSICSLNCLKDYSYLLFTNYKKKRDNLICLCGSLYSTNDLKLLFHIYNNNFSNRIINEKIIDIFKEKYNKTCMLCLKNIKFSKSNFNHNEFYVICELRDPQLKPYFNLDKFYHIICEGCFLGDFFQNFIPKNDYAVSQRINKWINLQTQSQVKCQICSDSHEFTKYMMKSIYESVQEQKCNIY